MKSILTLFGIIFLILLLGAYIGWNVVQDTLGLRPDEVRAFFLKGESLVLVRQPLLSGQMPVRDSLHLLFDGPDTALQKKGYYTALPPQLRLQSYALEGETVILKLNDGFDQMTGGSSQIRAAVAQLVYTVTAQKGIRKVLLTVAGREGQPLVIGGEGFVIDKALTREDISF